MVPQHAYVSSWYFRSSLYELLGLDRFVIFYKPPFSTLSIISDDNWSLLESKIKKLTITKTTLLAFY